LFKYTYNQIYYNDIPLYWVSYNETTVYYAGSLAGISESFLKLLHCAMNFSAVCAERMNEYILLSESASA
jgi:hypothetical protein